MAERLSILNDPPKLLAGPQLLHELIEWNVNSGACAIDFTKLSHRKKYSYTELHSCTKLLVGKILDCLAKRCPQSGDTRQQHIVPVLLPQSPGLYISEIAVLTSGGAFCPLNIDSPVERLKFNVNDVGAKFVITSANFKNMFLWEGGPEIIIVEEFPEHSNKTEIRSVSHQINPNDLAYVMYTSGSSGTPKGVGVSHLAASQSLLAHELFLPEFERFLQFASPSFDVSVFEVFFPLKRGKTLVGCEKTQLMNDLPGMITLLNVDAAELTPGVAASLLEKRANAPSLKLLLTIGEMLTTPVVEEFGGSETQDKMLYGMYGPTEAAIHCTVYPEMEAAAKPGNIGVPFESVSTFIAVPSISADDASDLKFVRIGEIGELLLGGPQLASGYLNREDQNKVSFVRFEGRQFYRTGDKARQLANGTIEILGRISSGQVKLRGQRLELGEVEEAVYKHPGVKTAVATVLDNNLIVYALIRDQSLTESEIVRTCAKWLPKYMLPSEIVLLDKFPYLPSGKIDKRQLTSEYETMKKATENNYSHTMNDTQLVVKNVLDEVLTGFRDSMRLSSAGLDSLKAIRVASKLRKSGFNVSTVAVLKAETLWALASICDESQTGLLAMVRSDFVTKSSVTVLNGSAKHVEFTMECTPLQCAMLAETAKDASAYHNWVELELHGLTDLNHIISSLHQLAEVNSILRTGFVELNNKSQLLQIIWDSLDEYEIEEVPQFNYEFNPAKDTSLHRPIRIQLLQSSSSTRLLIHIHHALYDAWSLELMLDDLNSIISGKELSDRPPFRDLVNSYENGSLQIDSWASKDYWRDHLEHLDCREIPNFHPGKAPKTGLAIARLSTSLPTSWVESTSRALAVSPHAIFQAAYTLVLASYLGTTDLCFGTVFSGRTLPVPGIEDIVGPCLATLPVRIDTSVIETLGELVRELNSTSRKHLEHSLLPLRDIKAAAGVHPGQPLFDTLIIWQQTLHSFEDVREFVSLVDTNDNLEFNLTLEISPSLENIKLKVNYQSTLFPEQQIATFLRQVEYISKLIVEEPTSRLEGCFSDLQHTLVSMENINPQTLPQLTTLSSPVEEIARNDPDRPAIEFARSIGDFKSDIEQVAYSQLNIRANQIGGYLLSQNILPDDVVCILMEKCVTLYSSILAVAKVGAGYLPQTPDVPLDRLKHILNEAKPKLVLTESSSRPLLKAMPWLEVVYVDKVDFGNFSRENIPPRSSLDNLSYCVYTSGSTGVPKGVLVSQGNLLSNLNALEDMYPTSKNFRMLQQCTHTFDVSVFEIFFTWRVGGCLCSAVKDVLFRDLELAIRSFDVTHLSMTPSVAALVDPQNVPQVHFLVTSGEALTPKVKNAWQDKGLWQGYGPSETTNICTVKPRVTRHDVINNIGRPLKNTSAFVLYPTGDFSPVPLGGEGEFVFGGSQVFRGYVDASKESGKIIDHPVFGRLYRSGDYGRMLVDGSLLFTCRKDDQVKIRGQRVELGEINNALLASDVVSDCVTILVDGKNGEQRLVSFWTDPEEDSAEFYSCRPKRSDIQELYQQLESMLPPYMIPSSLIPVSCLPTTASGKIDKSRLVSSLKDLDIEYLELTSPSTQTLVEHIFTTLEKDIVEAVATVTKIEFNKVGPNTSFFNLGIDSISAIFLSKVIRQKYHHNVEISDILKFPSVARLAERISCRQREPRKDGSQVARFYDFGFEKTFQHEMSKRFKNVGKNIKAIYPTTPLQEAMLSAGRLSASHLYLNKVTFDVFGDAEKLQSCWKTMVQRHEILRTCFCSTDMPRFPFVQVVLENHTLDFTKLNGQSKEFDEYAPPYAIELSKINAAQKLVISMHHALYDGVALAVLYEEVEMLYRGDLLPVSVSFAPFLKSLISLDMASSDGFWKMKLQNCHPTKFDSRDGLPQQTEISSGKIQGRFSQSFHQIEEGVKQNSTSLLAACQAVWSSVLSEICQESDICFGNVISGRTADIDGVERLVAPCFNTIPVRLDCVDKISYLEAFRKFQNLNADSLPFQLTPLRRIQSQLSPDGSRLFDSLFILQHDSRSLDSSIWAIVDDTGVMDFPLVCEIVPNHSEDTLEIVLHYYTSHFSESDVNKILNSAQRKLKDALKNSRRQLLPRSVKDQIMAKADERAKTKASRSDIDSDFEVTSIPEIKLREVISRFTDVPLDRIDRNVSFFRLGLDSISIIQVAAQARKLGYGISASDMLEHPSLAKISQLLTRKDQAKSSVESFNFIEFNRKYRKDVCSKNNLDADDVEAIRPCTSVQQGMLAATLHSDGQEYVNSIWFELQPDVSVTKLKEAWSVVTEDHEMLRTGFVSLDDSKYLFAMVTFKKTSLKFPWKDISLDETATNSHDLLHQPWSLILSAENETRVLHFKAHHALYDARSIQLILDDVARAYDNRSIAIRPGITTLLSAILRSSDESQAEKEAFWKSPASKIVVNRFPELTPLQIYDTRCLVEEVVSQSTLSELEAQCRTRGVTMQAATQVAWARLLAAYIGETSTTFGVTFSGNSVHIEGDQVAFPTIVTLPARFDVSGTNATLLSRTMDYNAALHKHQFTPLTSIQKWAGYPTGKIFDTLFAYQKMPQSEQSASDLPWKIVKEEASVDYAVSMEVQPSISGQVILRLTFRGNIIPFEHANIILRQYDAILLDTLQNPNGDSEVAPQRNRRLLSITTALEDVLPTKVHLLHEFVSSGARTWPEKIALEFATSLEPGNLKSQKWTYIQLDEESNKVANFLVNRGANPGDMIAICFDKCAEASFAIIGIMKAGATYVALDPTAPDERSKFIVQDSAAKMILSRGTTAQKLNTFMDKEIISFDSLEFLDHFSVGPPKLCREIIPKDTSYCLYTSGTTGTPKGCLITHDNAVQFMLAFSRLFAGNWEDDSKYLQFASFHFDVSVMEQFWSWSVGMCVASAPRDLIFEDIPGAINILGITHIDLTPSLARLVHPGSVPKLCKGAFITGGEQLKQEILDVWGEHGCIYNGYGPTEVTIGCTMYCRVPKNGKPANIGPAYVNSGSYVMKPGTEIPVLRGGVGELCVSGKLVGKGYLNRPDLTAERFPTLKEFNERVYRTGDLVRILHDGSFIFLGRADDQVKLRGQRLELSEINQVIKKSIKDIQEVVTLVLKHEAQQKEQLVTFFVLSGTVATSEGNAMSKMREACKSKLPGYMVPTHFIPIKSIPLNTNNKADSKQLGTMYNSISVEELQKLGQSGHQDREWTESEKPLIDIIARAIRTEVNSVTRSSNIFELGLDSISIIGFSRALQRDGLENAKLSVVKSNPMIGNLVQALMKSDTPDHGIGNSQVSASQAIAAFSQRHIVAICRELGIDNTSIESVAPCTPVQEGIIYKFLESDHPLYFNKFEFRLHDGVDVEKLLSAWSRVVERLEVLRTRFVATDDGFAQVVLRKARYTQRDTNIDHDAVEKSVALKNLYRLNVESSKGSQTLMLRIFHGLYDGNSLSMMLHRLVEEYRELENIDYGPSFMAALPYGPLAKVARAEEFWKSHLQNWSHHSMPVISGESSNDIILTRSVDLEDFDSVRKQLSVTPQAMIQAAWVSVLQNILSPNLTTGIVTSGRAIDLPDADKIIGPLFNTVPFHIDIEISSTSTALVSKCHEYNMQMQDYQHTPLKDIQKWGPSKPGQPLFETLFVFQRLEAGDERFADGIWTQVDGGQIADYPLAFEATLSPDSLSLSMTIVAQGSVITEIQVNELLEQMKEAILAIIESGGQNQIFASSSSNKQDVVRDNGKPPRHSPSATSNECFKWTKQATIIREEISKLAGVPTDSVLEKLSIFELGLDSIDVIKLASRLKKQNVEIPVSAIIRSQSIARMIQNLSPKVTGTSTPAGTSVVEIGHQLRIYLESVGKLPEGVEAILPATPLQQSMVNEMIKSDFERYFNIDAFKLVINVSLEKLMDAVMQVVENSLILRTTFLEIDDPKLPFSYAQVIHKNLSHFQNGIRTTALPSGQDITTFMQAFKDSAISLAKDSHQLFQVQTATAGADSYLVIAISHALYDGTSLRNIHDDIQKAYNGKISTHPDFIPFLEEVFQSTTNDAKNFWRTTLSGLPVARLPRKELIDVNEGESKILERRSRISLVDIEELCKSSRITLQTLGQTCWAIVLSKLMGQLDVVFGSVLSCRDTEEAGEVIFPLMNTVAMRAVLHGTFDEMLTYMQDMSDSIRQYQHFPLGMAQSYALASRTDRDQTGDTTLFDTLFIYQGRRSTEGLVPLYESVYGVSDVEFPICVEMEIVDDAYLSWTTKCKAVVRDEAETERILDALESVLERLVAAPNEQTMVIDKDGVSICGLPPFHIAQQERKEAVPQGVNSLVEPWSETELNIRKALQQISGVPEDQISKDTTIFHLGLDSIIILKLPALLKFYGIKLTVSTILRDQTVRAMARSAAISTIEDQQSFDADTVISKALSNIDLAGEMTKLGGNIGRIKHVMPATAGQIYMIRRWQATRGTMFYHAFTYIIPVLFNKRALELAWKTLLARHDILRTGFIEIESQIVQVIFEDPPSTVIYVEYGEEPVTRKQYPDLKLPPLDLVVQQSEHSAKIEMVIHHALYDGISLPILLNELQDLYFHGPKESTSTIPAAEGFKTFVARTITDSTSAKEKWVAYLGAGDNSDDDLQGSNIKLTAQQETGGKFGRVELFQPANQIPNLKDRAKKEGITIDALFLAGLAQILSSLSPLSQPNQDQDLILGIYLSNRFPHGTNLSSLAAPTLNLLPLLIMNPKTRDIMDIARNIQTDLAIIGGREMVGANLEDIERWTGRKVGVWVNFLKGGDDEDEANKGENGSEEGWKSLLDLGGRKEVVSAQGNVNEKMDLRSANEDAYLPAIDIELRYRGPNNTSTKQRDKPSHQLSNAENAENEESVDIGIFAPSDLLSLDGAQELVERFLSLWRE